MSDDSGAASGGAEALGLPLDQSETITLKRPLRVANRTITELTLREPTAGELRKSANGENGTAAVIILLSLICGIPEAMIEVDLLASDFAKVNRFFGDFLVIGPSTGPS